MLTLLKLSYTFLDGLVVITLTVGTDAGVDLTAVTGFVVSLGAEEIPSY
jgi:hypothetical protein